MKKIIFISLLLVTQLTMAQNANYGAVRLSHTEMSDSLHRINSTLDEIQKKLDKYNDGTTKMKNGYYYGGRDRTVDSLYNLRWSLINQKRQFVRSHEKELGLDVHLMKAGKYVRKAYALELFGIAFGVAGGVCLGKGISNDNTVVKVAGIVSEAAAFGCLIGAYTCHFKSGQKLRLAANSITYSF